MLCSCDIRFGSQGPFWKYNSTESLKVSCINVRNLYCMYIQYLCTACQQVARVYVVIPHCRILVCVDT
jgi:hypothetical protein